MHQAQNHFILQKYQYISSPFAIHSNPSYYYAQNKGNLSNLPKGPIVDNLGG